VRLLFEVERRFPPPWSIDELEACFVLIDSAGQKLAYVYFEEEPGRRSALYLALGGRALRGERYGRSGGALVLFAGTKEILARANAHHHERVWRPVVAGRRLRGYAIYLYAVLKRRIASSIAKLPELLRKM